MNENYTTAMIYDRVYIVTTMLYVPSNNLGTNNISMKCLLLNNNFWICKQYFSTIKAIEKKVCFSIPTLNCETICLSFGMP